MDRSEGAYQNPMSRALAAFCRRAAEQPMGNWRGEKRERRVRFFFSFMRTNVLVQLIEFDPHSNIRQVSTTGLCIVHAGICDSISWHDLGFRCMGGFDVLCKCVEVQQGERERRLDAKAGYGIRAYYLQWRLLVTVPLDQNPKESIGRKLPAAIYVTCKENRSFIVLSLKIQNCTQAIDISRFQRNKSSLIP